MATIFDLAQCFLSQEAMTHKKLQKMCYYAQAWSYAIFTHPITADGVFEAWVYGPVCPALYAKYKDYGFGYIPQYEPPVVFTKEEEAFLNDVWDTYGELYANALEALSQNEPPWQIARAGLDSGEPSNRVIKPDHMAEYYKSIYLGGDA